MSPPPPKRHCGGPERQTLRTLRRSGGCVIVPSHASTSRGQLLVSARPLGSEQIGVKGFKCLVRGQPAITEQKQMVGSAPRAPTPSLRPPVPVLDRNKSRAPKAQFMPPVVGRVQPSASCDLHRFLHSGLSQTLHFKGLSQSLGIKPETCPAPHM